MGRLAKDLKGACAWSDAAKDYLLNIGVHYDALVVLSPLGQSRHIVPTLLDRSEKASVRHHHWHWFSRIHIPSRQQPERNR